jgi:xylulokinase
MLLCGVDVGTSSIKVSVVDAANQQLIYSTSYPEIENEISAPELGFAEQDPEHWWYCVKQAILKANSSHTYDSKDIVSIGISYQMHGLVVIDKAYQVLRPSIIWCDSRSIEIGSDAYVGIGKSYCENNLLNSPGNFTASKLAWVKKHQPEIYDKIHLAMLPGDFIAGRFTNVFTTTNSALSEGIFWDFKANDLSSQLMDYFGFDSSMIPEVHPVFSNHGVIAENIAQELGFNRQVKVTYKAGDQPNNAFSLGVLEPGEVATTAGTSGVVYGVSDTLTFDQMNRVNSFAHVTHTKEQTRIGVLMCINGTGILNRWVRQNLASELSYNQMNDLASQSPIGSRGLVCLPFGNGAERIFQNRKIGASFENLDFNQHSKADLIRASQEGIAFSMAYGIEMLNATGIKANKLKAGYANMYLSDVFTSSLVNASNVAVDLCESDGSFGAALGSGFGLGYYHSAKEAVSQIKRISTFEPKIELLSSTLDAYSSWKESIIQKL